MLHVLIVWREIMLMPCHPMGSKYTWLTDRLIKPRGTQMFLKILIRPVGISKFLKFYQSSLNLYSTFEHYFELCNIAWYWMLWLLFGSLMNIAQAYLKPVYKITLESPKPKKLNQIYPISDQALIFNWMLIYWNGEGQGLSTKYLTPNVCFTIALNDLI